MTSARPLLLLDSASLYFRAFYGVPETITADDGTPVNAIRGFLDMIAQLVTDRRPGRLVACWDEAWRPAFRVEKISTYKSHRLADDGVSEMVPDGLVPQVPVIVEALAALGIARVGAAGYEADDVIGTLVAREIGSGSATPVEVVTGDRDLFQLVDDEAGVTVLYTIRGLKNLQTVDQRLLQEKYGVRTGQAYADLATLRGDPSDGLPGVAGVGEKTAASLLAKFGDLPGILAAVEAGQVSAAHQARFATAKDYLQQAPAVVRVARDAPVAEVDDALPAAPADPQAAHELAERWNLGGSMNRVLAALAG